MDDRIRMTAIFAIEPGRRDEFAAVVDKACGMLQSDSGTLCFEWFIDAEGTTCMGWEEYRDSESLIRSHLALADALKDALSMARIERQVILGPATDEVRRVMPDRVEFLGERHGFRR